MSKPPAHAGLLRAVRERLSSLGDEELLRLWVENDRGQYSEETFEAVRSLLTERGAELPPQNDPPPMAKRAMGGRWWLPDPPLKLDPTAASWYQWLRVMLGIGAAVLSLRLAAELITLIQFSSSLADYRLVGGVTSKRSEEQTSELQH